MTNDAVEASPTPTSAPISIPFPIPTVVGPTAAGKSGLGLELARGLGGEIINGDALQIYRRLSIGTDKPTDEMLGEIPHHLVNILEPTEGFSAGEFARRGRVAIGEILGRGRIPIVVGGSGLYLRALFEGFSPLPRSRPELRAELETWADRDGSVVLHRRLQDVDPETARRLVPQDRQRIVRALEIHRSSGLPMSDWLRKKPVEKPIPALRIGLTVPRAILYDRIADRVDQMVQKGWVSEVVTMLDQGIEASAPAFQAIGYRQIVRHVRGEISLQEAVRDTVQATRRYAKRQMTWFRKEPGVRWVSGLDLDTVLPSLLHDIQCMKSRLEERSLNEQA